LEVSFRSDGLVLAGTFVEASAPVAAALLLVGSGRIDRDSNAPRLRLAITDAIARALQEARISSLRYDKRGAGASEGDFLRTGLYENCADARSALAWLTAPADGLPLFAVGHSEGALHAAQLAAEGRVTGAVLVSMSPRRGEEVLMWQLQAIMPTLGRPARAIMGLLRIDSAETQRKRFAQIRTSSGDVLRIRGQRLNVRWLREFLDHDPAPVLAEITVPVLALTGGHDLQVPPQDTQAVCRLVRGPCSPVIIDDVSHVLRADPDSRGPRAYKRAVREPLDTAVLTAITEWLGRTAAAARAQPGAP
jgi:pimeloyl-ACP methyl ester carboxylesterase